MTSWKIKTIELLVYNILIQKKVVEIKKSSRLNDDRDNW